MNLLDQRGWNWSVTYNKEGTEALDRLAAEKPEEQRSGLQEATGRHGEVKSRSGG